MHTGPAGVAYVLLDGVGSSPAVRAWTRRAAARLARACAHQGAEAGLRAEYARYTGEPDRHDEELQLTVPYAAAVAAVCTPAGVLSVAWCGDARAYVVIDGTLRQLTEDHNEGRSGGSPDALTSCLGAVWGDTGTEERYGHPAIETTTGPLPRPARLLLASDGAYGPYETTGGLQSEHLPGLPEAAARRLVEDAVTRARELYGPAADNASVLVADLPGPAEAASPVRRNGAAGT